MLSETSTFTRYYLLESPVNSWVSSTTEGATSPGDYRMKSFEELIEELTGRDFESGEWDYVPSLSSDFSDLGEPGDADGDGIPDEEDESGMFGSTFHGAGTPEEGRHAIHPNALYSQGAGGGLYQFFPDVEREMLWGDAIGAGETGAIISGEGHRGTDGTGFDGITSYVTQMEHHMVYYRPPPRDNYGFIDSQNPFATANKTTFRKKINYKTDESMEDDTSQGYEYINPCPGCRTTGRAWNGWSDMVDFYTSDVHGIDIDLEAAQIYLIVGLRAAGLIDEAGSATLSEQAEISTNSYGTAPWHSLFSYESWYAILTTHTQDEDMDIFGDDFIMLSYYHTDATIKPVGYDTSIHNGGFPDQDMGTDPGWAVWYRAPKLNSLMGTNQSWAPYLPHIHDADYYLSEDVADAIGSHVSHDGMPTWVGDSIGVNYINIYESSTNGLCYPFGDLMRRFGRRTSRYDGGCFDRIGTSDFSIGYIANKSWLLQNTLTVWTGKFGNKVHQQLSPQLSADMFHPVGYGEGYGGYTFSPTPGDWSYRIDMAGWFSPIGPESPEISGPPADIHLPGETY